MIKKLITIMERGHHCPESIAEVRRAKNVGDLVSTMFDYKRDLGKKHFPPLAFVREHYPRVKDICNMNGYFFDDPALKIKNIWRVILAGACNCTYTLDGFKSAHIIVRNKSHVRFILSDYSKVNIYLFEGGTYEIESKTGLSHVNIFRYE